MRPGAIKRVGVSVLRVGLLAALVYGVYAWRTAPLLPADGREPAPTWVLDDTAGRRWSDRDFSGQTTVLYFFAPWCAVCNASAPHLRWFDAWAGEETRLVLIALDWESPGAVIDFAERHGLRSPVLLGDAATASRFRVFGYPAYYVVDPAGRLAARDFGYTTVVGLWLRTFLARMQAPP